MSGKAPLFLASHSPRRQELLRQIGVDFELLSCRVDESPNTDEPAKGYVLRICRDKLNTACQLRPDDRPVLVADTAVVVDSVILGKPADRQEAQAMLERLAGRQHQVYSAVGIGNGSRQEIRLNISEVQVQSLSPQQIQQYLSTEESFGKAGAYAIQGRFAAYITRLEGSYSGVMGLPLFETASLLEEFSIL